MHPSLGRVLHLGALALALVLVLGACGGSDGGDLAEDLAEDLAATGQDAEALAEDLADDLAATGQDAEDLAQDLAEDLGATGQDAEELAEDLADTLEAAQSASGGGSMTLTVGEQSFTFAPVLCAFGEEQIGQEGAEFVLSSVQDGMQMYVSIDRFGHSVSLDDIEDFANPSVSLSAFGADEFIMLDGKSFSGQADFVDNTSESFDTIAGTFSGTCP